MSSDGAAVFLGAMLVVGGLCIAWSIIGITSVVVTDNAVTLGYIKQNGKIYSVKPATAIKVD